MVVYFGSILIISVTYMLLNDTEVRIKSKSINGKEIGLLLSIILIVLLWGYRDISVGLDTKSYSVLYNWASNATIGQLNRYWIEPGYSLLTVYCANALHISYHHFLMLVSAFNGFCLYRFLKAYSYNKFVSILTFISFPLMSFYMSGIRNSIVISVMLISIRLLEEKKLWKIVLYEIIVVAISLLFHRSGIICTLIPLFAYRKKYKHLGVVYILVPVILFMSKGFIYQYITSNFKDVGSATGISIGTSFFVYLCFFIMILFLNRGTITNKKYDGKFDIDLLSMRLIYWSLIGALLSNGASDILSRMIIYYQMFYSIGIANSIEASNQETRVKYIVFLGTIIILLVYFYVFILMLDPYGIVPYAVYK